MTLAPNPHEHLQHCLSKKLRVLSFKDEQCGYNQTHTHVFATRHVNALDSHNFMLKNNSLYLPFHQKFCARKEKKKENEANQNKRNRLENIG